MRTEFHIKLGHFATAQFIIISTLILLTISSYLFTHVTGYDSVLGFLRLVDVGSERSIPTYFSTFNLLLASILIFIIYTSEKIINRSTARYWLLLFLLFLFLSIDEGTSIHENFGNIHRYHGIILPIFEIHSWVPYGIMFTLITGVIFIPFIKSLSTYTATYFVIAGAVFIGGAIGIEFLSAVVVHMGFAERGDLIYQLHQALEEGLEMCGIAIFNCALFNEIVSRNLMVKVELYTKGVKGLPTTHELGDVRLMPRSSIVNKIR